MKRPQPDEYASFYKEYIRSVKNDVIIELTEQAEYFPELLKENSHKEDFAYAEGKWTLKEMLGHIIDTERIMAYRIVCISRNDQTPLPAFDQDNYVKFADFSQQRFNKLIREFEMVRNSTLLLVDFLNQKQLSYRGSLNNNPVTARALTFIIAGHLNHHTEIIRQRYI